MNGKSSPFLSHLDATAKDVDELLDRLLSATPAYGELSRPAPAPVPIVAADNDTEQEEVHGPEYIREM